LAPSWPVCDRELALLCGGKRYDATTIIIQMMPGHVKLFIWDAAIPAPTNDLLAGHLVRNPSAQSDSMTIAPNDWFSVASKAYVP
jgi:hypothetical protein